MTDDNFGISEQELEDSARRRAERDAKRQRELQRERSGGNANAKRSAESESSGGTASLDTAAIWAKFNKRKAGPTPLPSES